MNKINKFFYVSCLIIVGVFSAVSCEKPDKPNPPVDTFVLSGVSIPGTISVTPNANVEITGKGFASGDKIVFTLSGNSAQKFEFNVASVTANSVSINIGSQITSGTYNISAVRGAKSISLGSAILRITANTTIPDISGKNIKGVVYCNGRGVAGVAVSDGVEVTTTNADGVYYLQSDKRHGYVFISIPANYEVPQKNKLPFFFDYVTSSTAVVDQRNFELIEANNENHVLIAMPDMHLSNRNNDISQFRAGFYAEAQAYSNQLKSAGTKVYGIALGDMTWDVYWYENSYFLNNYVNEIDGIGFQIFNIMGNHDNDPYKVMDFQAESTYKSLIGPSYYSFNLGKVHYVVLDDTEYINTGGAPGVIGARNYNDAVTSEQLAWLQKDLALISDKSTPVVVALHIPLYSASVNSSGQQVNAANLTNTAQVQTALRTQYRSNKCNMVVDRKNRLRRKSYLQRWFTRRLRNF